VDFAFDGRPNLGVLLLNEINHIAVRHVMASPAEDGRAIVSHRRRFDKRRSAEGQRPSKRLPAEERGLVMRSR
jgi:hypothetical protein